MRDFMQSAQHLDEAGKTVGMGSESTYRIRLHRLLVIVAVGGGAERGAQTLRARRRATDASSLGQVLIALGLPDLHHLFLATTTQLFRLESILRLELGPTVIGNVSLRHDCSFCLVFASFESELAAHTSWVDLAVTKEKFAVGCRCQRRDNRVVLMENLGLKPTTDLKTSCRPLKETEFVWSRKWKGNRENKMEIYSGREMPGHRSNRARAESARSHYK
jgi:hypothetical protein